jgi:hypothetical protein
MLIGIPNSLPSQTGHSERPQRATLIDRPVSFPRRKYMISTRQEQRVYLINRNPRKLPASFAGLS